MIRSFKDLNSQPQSFPDPSIFKLLRQKFPNKTAETLNKALIITNNSFDLSCALINSGCKLDLNKYMTSNTHQVISAHVNIVLYKNGLLISDKFFSYTIKKNREILEKIKNGEINYKLIGNENDGYVKLFDKSDESYKIHTLDDTYFNQDIMNDDIMQQPNLNEKSKEEPTNKKLEKKEGGFTLGELRRRQEEKKD
ncbi:UBX domain-containing protein 2A [Cucumispora dikerogammari]|nr:UBX domain-containing protein 2A [Cucumispora dikerogammari]